MHGTTKAELETLAALAMARPAGAKRWQAFLDGLANPHAGWHARNNGGTKVYGFLLFHWEVIRRFKEVGAPARFGRVTPISAASLAAIGAPYAVRVLVPRGDIEALARFSAAIERWHDGVLGAMTHPGHPMGDPRQNIQLLDFWRLHYFMNSRFEQKLRTFRSSAAQTIPEVVAEIEVGHHARVPEL